MQHMKFIARNKRKICKSKQYKITATFTTTQLSYYSAVT